MSKVAIIGDSDIVAFFSSCGFDGFSVSDTDEAKEALAKVIRENYSICYITEVFAKDMLDDIKDLSIERLFPIITIISDHRKKFNIASEKIKLATIKAVGSEVLTSVKELKEG